MVHKGRQHASIGTIGSSLMTVHESCLPFSDWAHGRLSIRALAGPCKLYQCPLMRRSHLTEAHTASQAPGMLTHMTNRQ